MDQNNSNEVKPRVKPEKVYTESDLHEIRRVVYFTVLALIVVLLLETIAFWINCVDTTGEFTYQPVINRRTGEPISVLLSTVCYALLIWVMGMLPAVVNAIIVSVISHVIPVKSSELRSAAIDGIESLPFVSTYVVVVAIVVLVSFGVIKVHF